MPGAEALRVGVRSCKYTGTRVHTHTHTHTYAHAPRAHVAGLPVQMLCSAPGEEKHSGARRSWDQILNHLLVSLLKQGTSLSLLFLKLKMQMIIYDDLTHPLCPGSTSAGAVTVPQELH